MKRFIKIISTCIAIEAENIDTDQIVPARFLKITTREGFGKYLFYDWRFDKNGKPKKNKYFNYSNLPAGKVGNQNAQILVAGNNFGCGSSREHAVWAIQDFGFKVVISSSFGDIFYNNSLKNGLLPIVLKPSQLEKLFQAIEKYPQTKVTVDLEKQLVITSNSPYPPLRVRGGNHRQVEGELLTYHFSIDSFRKACLLKGVDELGYILSFKNKIKAYEDQHKIYLFKD